MRCYSKIQSDSASFQAHQEDPAVWIMGEGVYGSPFFSNVHGSIQLDTLDARLPNHRKLVELSTDKDALRKRNY